MIKMAEEKRPKEVEGEFGGGGGGGQKERVSLRVRE